MDGKTAAERAKIKDDFEKLCAMHCTETEICAWFDVTDKTLAAYCKRVYGKGFSEVYAEKRMIGRISLRRAQFQLATKSATMAIFLGKQWLDQKDNPVEVTHTLSPIDQITQEIFRVQNEQRDELEDAESDAEC